MQMETQETEDSTGDMRCECGGKLHPGCHPECQVRWEREHGIRPALEAGETCEECGFFYMCEDCGKEVEEEGLRRA